MGSKRHLPLQPQYGTSTVAQQWARKLPCDYWALDPQQQALTFFILFIHLERKIYYVTTECNALFSRQFQIK